MIPHAQSSFDIKVMCTGVVLRTPNHMNRPETNVPAEIWSAKAGSRAENRRVAIDKLHHSKITYLSCTQNGRVK